ncbi:MAG: LOG family protein, partial [Hydrogenophaga sp.]|nr:LOG family protein [Hydrogenophaga sp.]
FEEFFEAWTWRQLGYHDKPVGLLNTNGYYDGLMTFLRNSVEQEFMGEWQMDLIRADADVQRLLPALIQAAGFSPASRLDEI